MKLTTAFAVAFGALTTGRAVGQCELWRHGPKDDGFFQLGEDLSVDVDRALVVAGQYACVLDVRTGETSLKFETEWDLESVDLSGDRAVVADPFYSGILQFGIAAIHDSITGERLFVLQPADVEALDWFGADVLIAGDRVFVCAPGWEPSGKHVHTDYGTVYLFDLATGKELTKKQMRASDEQEDLGFGWPLEASEDRLAVGAWGDASYTGAVYLYDLQSRDELMKIVPPDGAPLDIFSTSIAIDGEHLAVGAPWDDDMGENSGSVYVFDVRTGRLLRKLTAPDGDADDEFGTSVALSGDRLYVGAMYDEDVAAYAGSAYAFDLTTGQALFKLTASDGAADDYFGWGLRPTGGRLLVAAPSYGGTGNGGVYAYSLPAPLGSSSCGPAVPNSTGRPGSITAVGTEVASCNQVVLTATDLPSGRFGCFLASRTQGLVTGPGGSQGDLCLGGAWAVLPDGARTTRGVGSIRLQVDLTDLPPTHHAVQPGETWTFQCWYRDANPQPTSNFTDAVALTFE